MFDYKLEPEVYSFHLLNELIKAAEKEGVTNFPIHIKLDTGMHRLGFTPDEIPELIERLKSRRLLFLVPYSRIWWEVMPNSLIPLRVAR